MATVVCFIVGLFLLVRLLAMLVPFDIPVISADSLRGLTPVLIYMVAAVIATREWLMHEEHVLLPIGKKYIELVIALIVQSSLLIIFSYPLPLHDLMVFVFDWMISNYDRLSLWVQTIIE